MTRNEVVGIKDWTAKKTVQFCRFSFDKIVLMGFDAKTCNDERAWLNRVIFLETVAGIPGMVGAM